MFSRRKEGEEGKEQGSREYEACEERGAIGADKMVWRSGQLYEDPEARDSTTACVEF